MHMHAQLFEPGPLGHTQKVNRYILIDCVCTQYDKTDHNTCFGVISSDSSRFAIIRTILGDVTNNIV